MDAFKEYAKANGLCDYLDEWSIAEKAFRAGMRAAAAICRERSKKLEPGRTEHTQEGCYECGAEDEADYLATAILAEADK